MQSSSLFHKSLSLIFNIIGYLNLIAQLRMLHVLATNTSERNANFYFTIFASIFQQIPPIYFQFGVWFHGNRFKKLIEHIIHNAGTLPPLKPIWWQNHRFMLTLFTTVPFLITYESVLMLFIFPSSQSILQTAVEAGRFYLFLDSYSVVITSSLKEQYTILDYIACVIGFFANLNRIALSYFAALAFFVSVLTIWTMSRQFYKLLECNKTISNEKYPISNLQKSIQFAFDKPLTWMYVREIYDGLKEVCLLSSSAFGSLITAMIACQMILQSTYLDKFIFENDWKTQIPLLFVFTCALVGVILSAEVVVHVRC